MFQKEKFDVHLTGMCRALIAPDAAYLTDRYNKNLKSVCFTGGRCRVLYESNKSITCLCQFQSPAAAQSSPCRLALCEETDSEKQLVIVSQQSDGSFREEKRISHGSQYSVSQIHQVRNVHLILYSCGSDAIWEVPLDQKGNPLPGWALKLPSGLQSVECVGIGHHDRILISFIDQTCRSLVLDGQQLVERSQFPVSGWVDLLLWNQKTNQLLVKTEKSVESYRAGSSIDELLCPPDPSKTINK